MEFSVHGYLFSFFFLLSSPLASPLLPSPFLGIAPQDEEYFVAEVIACRDGSKSFRKDWLNDGFCDCPDGTDEPGTSACPESKFYCKNLGDVPRYLFSSRVNDRYCDCCDGSDEYDGSISCPNTCLKDESMEKRSENNHIEERKSNSIDTQERGKRVDLDDLFQNLTELRIALMVELLVPAIMITCCLFHWRARSRRRRYIG